MSPTDKIVLSQSIATTQVHETHIRIQEFISGLSAPRKCSICGKSTRRKGTIFEIVIGNLAYWYHSCSDQHEDDLGKRIDNICKRLPKKVVGDAVTIMTQCLEEENLPALNKVPRYIP